LASSCAAPPPPPAAYSNAPSANCPVANQHPGWVRRIERVQSNIVVEYVADPASFVVLLNEASPITYYTAPDKIVFVHPDNSLVGSVYLIYDNCIEGRIQIPVDRFKAMNEYQGD